MLQPCPPAGLLDLTRAARHKDRAAAHRRETQVPHRRLGLHLKCHCLIIVGLLLERFSMILMLSLSPDCPTKKGLSILIPNVALFHARFLTALVPTASSFSQGIGQNEPYESRSTDYWCWKFQSRRWTISYCDGKMLVCLIYTLETFPQILSIYLTNRASVSVQRQLDWKKRMDGADDTRRSKG